MIRRRRCFTGHGIGPRDHRFTPKVCPGSASPKEECRSAMPSSSRAHVCGQIIGELPKLRVPTTCRDDAQWCRYGLPAMSAQLRRHTGPKQNTGKGYEGVQPVQQFAGTNVDMRNVKGSQQKVKGSPRDGQRGGSRKPEGSVRTGTGPNQTEGQTKTPNSRAHTNPETAQLGAKLQQSAKSSPEVSPVLKHRCEPHGRRQA